MRAQIIVDVDNPDEVEAAESWIAEWRDRLASVSEDKGCGCCVHMWDVEGSKEVLETIPDRIRARALTAVHAAAERLTSGGVTIFTDNHQRKSKHMKRFKRIRIIGVVLLVLAAAIISIALAEGEKSVLQSIGAGGGLMAVGGALLGMSLRLENKEKACGDTTDEPKS
ncbi:MAG: hypothetical protein U1F36_13550 [Planctomycetota bacterium]